jgi:pilus assembly protein CpaB
MGSSRAFIVSLVLTAVAMLLVYTYVDTQKKELRQELGSSVDILRATKNITEYSGLDKDSVEIARVPSRFQQPNYLSSPEDVQNTVAAIPIAKGEYITTNKLLFLGTKTGLAPVVSKGKRAVAIQASALTSVGNMIKPGDRIDIIAKVGLPTEGNKAPDSEAKTVLQDVLVLSAGTAVYSDIPRFERAGGTDNFPQCVQKSTPNEGSAATNLTIELTPIEAQKIVLLTGSAQLYYTLRSPNDRETRLVEPLRTSDVFKSAE